jgi:hypothetical protein
MKRTTLALVAILLPGCAAIDQLFVEPTEQVVVSVRPDFLYEELVDTYVEMCAVSQYRPKQGVLGGIPGHAVMYLKGACFDETAGYPRLRRCKGNTADRSSPEHGAGVSVNKWFKNVNWVATPGKKLFFDGDLGPYDMLDQAHYDRTVQTAVDLGMYKGVEIHPIPGKEDITIPEFIAYDSIGTDFALRFGRSVYCTRMPVWPEQLVQMMDYLNSLNDQYQSGEREYNWSGYADNCVHTLHNAVAAAGIWEPKSIRAIQLRQIFNIAVPANTFIDLAHLANQYPIERLNKIRRDDLQWKNLTERDWLPSGPGTLMKSAPVHQENQLYDTKFRMLVLEGWFTAGNIKKARKLLLDGRFAQLDANLHYFRQRYDRILETRTPNNWIDKLRGEDWRNDKAAYYAYIERRRARLDELFDELAELDEKRERLLQRARAAWEKEMGRPPAPASP